MISLRSIRMTPNRTVRPEAFPTRYGAANIHGLLMRKPIAIVLAMIVSRILFHPKSKRLLRATAAFLLLVVVNASALPANAQAQDKANTHPPTASAPATPAAGSATRLTFDVASVRPGTQGYIKGSDFLDPVSDSAPAPGGLFSWNVPLVWLIDFAYDLRSPQLRRQAYEALPKPLQQGPYTVEARATSNPTRADVRQMVRSMLEERFQFTAHLEKREGEVYALQVAKPGLGLKPHPEGAPCTLSPAQLNGDKYPNAYPSYKQFAPHCGVFNRQLTRAGDRRFEMLNVTMQQMADSLMMPLVVVDHTGLEGRYDAVLEVGTNAIPQNPDTSDELGLPQLPAALEKQLGLKLVKQNAQIDAFVIDHIGTLTDN
jgi:uncharacterized protein (TIGR03435 family)